MLSQMAAQKRRNSATRCEPSPPAVSAETPCGVPGEEGGLDVLRVHTWGLCNWGPWGQDVEVTHEHPQAGKAPSATSVGTYFYLSLKLFTCGAPGWLIQLSSS